MTDRQLIKKLEAELASMQTELATLPTGDLKAMFLRNGIEATLYRVNLEWIGPEFDEKGDRR